MAKKNDTPTISLLQYDRTNIISNPRGSTPRISIGRTGKFSLNKAAVELTHGKAGSTMVLLQDENNVSDWYLRFGGKDGFPLRAESSGQLSFNATGLKDVLFASVEWTYGSAVCQVGEPMEGPDDKMMWPIVTKGMQFRVRKSTK
jgi:hypothetical protein